MADTALRLCLLRSCLGLFLLLAAACSGTSSASGAETGDGGRQPQRLMLPGADGMKLRVVLAGKGPLLLLPTPGWGISLELYEQSLRPLEDLFTVAYLDSRGSGESSKPGPAVLWSMERFVADLDRVRAALKRKRCYVLGHGSGSLMALSYALAHPEPCAGLLLVAGSASRGPEWQQAMFQRVDARGKREPAFLRRVQQVNDTVKAAGPALDDSEARGRFFAILPTMFADMGAFQKYGQAFASVQVSANAQRLWDRQSGRLDLRRDLAKIPCPVLVINGAMDHYAAPADAQILVSGLPRAESWIAPKAGHFPWLEAREAFFTRIKTWLAQRG